MVAFGTSGLRGLADELADGPASRHADGFCAWLIDTGRARPTDAIFLGRDRRDSSPLLLKQCAAAISGRGLRPVDCGLLPTPALALHAMGQRAGAIMVTGSHIPADRNGLKFYRPGGEIDKADEAAIARAAERAPPFAATVEAAAPESDPAATEAYRERILSLLPAGALHGLRIGIFEHSSVARDLLGDVLRALGAVTVGLGRSESFVPIDTEAVAAPLIAEFEEWCRAFRLDAVVSTDGDADRPLVTDEAGHQIRGDVLGLLTARRIGARSIVTPVTSNAGLESAGGFRVVRTRVGSPYVLAAMADPALAAPVVGFEANGGFLLGSDLDLPGGRLPALPTRDCMMPIVAVLGVRAESGVPLSRLVAELRLPVAAGDRIENYARDRADAFLAWLRGDPANAERMVGRFGPVDGRAEIDGLQLFLKGGATLHFRPSGNAPEMRCYAQAGDEATAAALLSHGLAHAAAFASHGEAAQ